jgi:hypothetical protein
MKARQRQSKWRRYSRHRTVSGEGVRCPRCDLPTEIREHREITAKHLSQPYYFTRWFYCRNPNCPVTLHMSEAYKVVNHERRSNLTDP